MVDGFVTAHSDVVSLPSPRVVARATPADRKVGMAIGGGSGHEPAFLGYVGVGMADSAAIGNIFAAPSADVIYASIEQADHGEGVILVYGNYSGDVLNCRLAMRRAATSGIDVRAVFVTDDVASAGPEEMDRRRGIAGDIFVFKAIGAAAERGLSLDEVEQVAHKTNRNTRSMGVALSSAELPGATEPIFASAPDEMDVGLGVHGEPGISRQAMATADEVGRLLCERILDDFGADRPTRVAVMVNGLGATPTHEQYLLFRAARDALAEQGITIERSLVGEFITSLQMAGASVTITALDDQLIELLDAPARTASYVR
jgi:dihydroxyacetone kinase-like protein